MHHKANLTAHIRVPSLTFRTKQKRGSQDAHCRASACTRQLRGTAVRPFLMRRSAKEKNTIQTKKKQNTDAGFSSLFAPHDAVPAALPARGVLGKRCSRERPSGRLALMVNNGDKWWWTLRCRPCVSACRQRMHARLTIVAVAFKRKDNVDAKAALIKRPSSSHRVR